ncbi:MAG: hypothetical protein HY925_15820 [Elusimicrobia bacterium]|nr:hypothetical protein [Elusimicrobiota bacterium]
MTRNTVLTAAGALLLGLAAGYSAAAAKAQPEFKQYWFVNLKAGPNQGGTPEEIERVQRGHRDNIDRLVQQGKLAVAGPFDDGGPLRGIFIFDVPDKEEVERLLATDPAIQNGRLRGEILAWWTERGRCLP